MKIYIEKKDFDLENTLLSGQCFRVIQENDWFICVISDRVIKIRQSEKYIEFISNINENLENVVREYFDLDTDYKHIIKELILKESNFKNILFKSNGYKILNQDSLEMIISYIISQNNNVNRISNSINMICEQYGQEMVMENKVYFLFPNLKELKKIPFEEFRKFKVGFRDRYLYEIIKNITEDYIDNIKNIPTEEALELLIKNKGVGLKVASCILLFGYHRFDTFPIDTWVRKYIKNNCNLKTDKLAEIKEYMQKHFDEYSGLVIQYMFNYERNIKN